MSEFEMQDWWIEAGEYVESGMRWWKGTSAGDRCIESLSSKGRSKDEGCVDLVNCVGVLARAVGKDQSLRR